MRIFSKPWTVEELIPFHSVEAPYSLGGLEGSDAAYGAQQRDQETGDGRGDHSQGQDDLVIFHVRANMVQGLEPRKKEQSNSDKDEEARPHFFILC